MLSQQLLNPLYGNIRYLLRDEFTTDLPAGSVDGTPAEPGPGTRSVVDLESALSISGGVAVFAAQSTPAWGDQGVAWSPSISRDLGVLLSAIINFSSWGGMGIAWHTALAIIDPDNAPYAVQAGATSGRLDKQGGVQIADGLSMSTDYQICLVLGGYDASGTPWDNSLSAPSYQYGASIFVKIGGDWVLLWREKANADALLYVVATGLDAEWSLDAVHVPNLACPSVLQPTCKSTFDAANGTSLDAIVPEVGGAWTENNGDWDIQGNRARIQALGDTSGTRQQGATIDAGISDVLIRTIVNPAGTSSGRGIRIRYTDEDNYWYVSLGSAGLFAIYERNSGVWTQRASTAVVVSPNTDYDILAVADGQTIVAYLDGGNRISYSSASMNQFATRHGIHSGSYTGNLFDNFHIHPRTGYTALDSCSG